MVRNLCGCLFKNLAAATQVFTQTLYCGVQCLHRLARLLGRPYRRLLIMPRQLERFSQLNILVNDCSMCLLRKACFRVHIPEGQFFATKCDFSNVFQILQFLKRSDRILNTIHNNDPRLCDITPQLCNNGQLVLLRRRA